LFAAPYRQSRADRKDAIYAYRTDTPPLAAGMAFGRILPGGTPYTDYRKQPAHVIEGGFAHVAI
jgi:hypothetical protein